MKTVRHAWGLWGMTVAVVLVLGCGNVPDGEMDPPLRPVRYVEIREDDGVRMRTFTGLARAGMVTRMSFRVPGTLQALPVRVGDMLEKGQLIAKLDATDFQLRVQEAEASVSRARAEARNADAVYGRVQALYERRNVSRSELDMARAASESARAAVRSLENHLALARRQLAYTGLNAPDRCGVAAVLVEENENVGAGQAVAVVNCGSRVDVRIAVPAIHISGVREGMAVEVRVDALGQKTFSGVVAEVGLASVGLETTFPVTVRLETRDAGILPGMAAEVMIPMVIHGGAVRVPFRSVGEDERGRFVFCLRVLDNGVAEVVRRDVVLGGMGSDGIEVLEGLVAGDLVVTAGVGRVREGERVKLWEGSLP
ncbi:efflux RND transporter periplasmic adaptor subunit [Desulfobotulus sp. H1]|uniref:Efflux RND transporter periplasmic adaptor subunit n=1 Tax=Desulfobotulus pelophilus TaxID=2823377 RepID=A0ABT3N9J9_9BACT|nr:efflux RND transporter periplasmic adaptor subunit [Desulfobotulus pelophilus]MCW7753841.1 efflux RND transporter periplasmic adaptor subunit [Desulfobotulus pelophilus]